MEEQTQQTTENNNTGIQPEAGSIVDRADSIAKRLEESEKRIDEKLKKMEDLQAKMILGGRSFAGSTAPIESVEDKKKRAAREFWKGTMIDSALDKYG